jgi:hypothetical protein
MRDGRANVPERFNERLTWGGALDGLNLKLQ